MSDPYLEPRSGVLRNKFGITDQEILNRKEADVVMLRSILLQSNPIKGNFDSDHLRQIHFHLFKDVYDWAGQFRIVPLAKAEYIHGGTVIRFTPPQSIAEELRAAFNLLEQDGFLKGLRRREFASKIARLFSEINRIHPFREGNGRAQREFVRQLSQSVGYKLHFGVVSRERMVQAREWAGSARAGEGDGETASAGIRGAAGACYAARREKTVYEERYRLDCGARAAGGCLVSDTD